MSADPFAAFFSVVRAGQDFTARQIAILRLVQTEPAPKDRQIKSLATSLAISKPVVSRAADRLQEDGYVTRGILDTDKRSCVLSITRKGLSLMASIAGEKPARRAA